MAGAFGRDTEYLELLNDMIIKENLRLGQGLADGGSNSQMSVLGANRGSDVGVEGLPAEMMPEEYHAVSQWGEGPVAHKIMDPGTGAFDIMDGPQIQQGHMGTQSGPAGPQETDDWRYMHRPEELNSSNYPGGFEAEAGEESRNVDPRNHEMDLEGAFLEQVNPDDFATGRPEGGQMEMQLLEWLKSRGM